MSRWIDKMITRHLEPEHNVRPFIGGLFHAVWNDEGMPGEGEEMAWGNVKKGSKRKENDLRDGEGARQDTAKVVTGERKELKDEKNDLERKKTVPGGYEGKIVEENEGIFPGIEGAIKEEAGKGVERVARGSERVLKGEEKNPAVDDAGVKGIPVIRGRVQTQAETKIKYVTREAPVLIDAGEGERQVHGVEQAPGQGRAVMNAPGIVKGDPPMRQAIHVSIGRIEIKAVMAPPAEAKAAPVKKDKEIMGLDQYLEQRNPAKQ